MIAEFSIVPLGEGHRFGAVVAESLAIVEKSGLDYRLTAMGTILEGDWDEVFAVIRECHENIRGKSARVATRISIDDRVGARGQLAAKVKSVEDHIGHELRT